VDSHISLYLIDLQSLNLTTKAFFMRLLVLLFGISIHFFASSQTITTRYEQSGGTQTPGYSEIIQWWQQLDTRSGKVKMLTMGMTDAGQPLHLVFISNNGDYNTANIHKNDKRIILINNGIHPGEPDGIDASMLLARDIVLNKYSMPDNVVLAIIPVYNIGGCLNRSEFYRPDQNGPSAFGSRGNSQNLDLNRDFIKCDSKDARAFTAIFHELDPDVFIDNHVSNGADYQHVMTLLTTQHNKLGKVMGEYLEQSFEPALYSLMKERGFDLVPYVNHFGDTPPEDGWTQFWDSPRYGSGYGALWNTFSFVPETHMLKPYDQRVKSTYALMQSFIEYTGKHSFAIRQHRDIAKIEMITASSFPISWTHDNQLYKEIDFKGYKQGYKPSEVSGLPRLYYDRNQPFEKKIKFYNVYTPQLVIQKPKAYIIPQGWWKVIELLKLNNVKMTPLKKDTTIWVETYYIEDYKPAARQYEMHHPNSEVKVQAMEQDITFRKGDWYIPMDQVANRFLIETLEPQAEDSYFSWNYFDAILGQKEGYSAYAFEDIAADYMNKNSQLKRMLEEKRASDTAFAKSGKAQLDFVYRNSRFSEPGFLRYPVYRLK
jgi:hypothetical protein